MGQKLIIDKDTLTEIADAVREKSGTSDLIKVTDLSQAIIDIPSGGATEPYIEETYNSSGHLVGATFHGYTRIDDYAFFKRSSLALSSLPSTITEIGEYAFSGCSNLALTTLPAGITAINQYTFNGCKQMLLDSFPSGIAEIGNMAFNGCTALTNLTFEGTPQTISATAFTGCTNLTTINVPWSEGVVAGAPWGATNATINYNYTGE